MRGGVSHMRKLMKININGLNSMSFMFEALLAGTAVLDARNNTHSSYSYAYKVEYARKSWAVLRTSAQPIYHPFSIQHIMLLYEDKIAYVLHEH